jgi:hypothetical protein
MKTKLYTELEHEIEQNIQQGLEAVVIGDIQLD